MGAFRRRGAWAAFLLFFCLPAAARETVTWFVDQSYPAAHIASGPYEGQGLLDRELKWLIAHLPQYDHEVVDSTGARTWREIGRKDARCSSGALKTPEREKKALFSVPATRAWNVMLIVRDDRLSAMRGAQAVSGNMDLARLFQQDGLHGVVNIGRSYGPFIDPLLSSPDGKRAVGVVSNSIQGLRMVMAGRADYAIGYSHELAYFRKVDGSSEPVTIMPIEGVDRYSTGYIACSDQPIGRAVISAINAAIAREGVPPPYMVEAKQWLNDKEFDEISSPALWSGR
jgi:uncharacterized protein (TIGR02285 family)